MKRGGNLPPRAPGSAGKASQFFYTVFIVAFLVWCIALVPGLQGASSSRHNKSLFPVRAKSAGSAALSRLAELYDSLGGGLSSKPANAISDIRDSRVGEATQLLQQPALPGPYEGAAIVTLAGGDTSAKHAIVLIQSLRDVGTVLPIVVLLARGGLGSAACQNNTWRRINNRDHIQCTGPDTIGTMRRLARNCSLTLFPTVFEQPKKSFLLNISRC